MLSTESISIPGAEQKLIGSLMVFEAPTLEEVRKIIESDLYYSNGVVSTVPTIFAVDVADDLVAIVGSRAYCDSAIPRIAHDGQLPFLIRVGKCANKLVT